MNEFQRKERFDTYRRLWVTLCVIGSKLRQRQPIQTWATLEDQYDFVLREIREKQAAFDRDLEARYARERAARSARKGVPACS